jgi:hypothetical protein
LVPAVSVRTNHAFAPTTLAVTAAAPKRTLRCRNEENGANHPPTFLTFRFTASGYM